MSKRAILRTSSVILPSSAQQSIKRWFIAAKNFLAYMRCCQARLAFDRASNEPQWLDRLALEAMHAQNKGPPKVDYGRKALKVRGDYRAKALLLILDLQSAYSQRFLELGCGDGMVSSALRRFGKTAAAIDLTSKNFDKRALADGVTMLESDTVALPFRDQSFDCVFSYAAFEHFGDPQKSMEQAIRVVKIGGYIYANFGPLYYSPWGAHAYRLIRVPYLQYLFPAQLIREFAFQKAADHPDIVSLDDGYVNRWSLEQFRGLWQSLHDILEAVVYFEKFNAAYVDLIQKYPSHFRSKTDSFDNLVVESLEVLFKRVH
jgi:ubiquinone/menaquinone biosynthesis C-methylase UbiE